MANLNIFSTKCNKRILIFQVEALKYVLLICISIVNPRIKYPENIVIISGATIDDRYHLG